MYDRLFYELLGVCMHKMLEITLYECEQEKGIRHDSLEFTFFISKEPKSKGIYEEYGTK